MKPLSYIVVFYMLAALIWWSVLLFRKNNQIFELQTSQIQQAYNTIYGTENFDILDTPEYKESYGTYQGQFFMILGEAIVFGLSLTLGIYFIYRSYRRDLKTAEKQKNFLLSVTHELKSPITSINLSLDTLRKRKLEGYQISQISDAAIQESNRLEKLINNLLFVAKIDHDYQYFMEDISIPDLISEMSNTFSIQYPDQQIHWENHSQSGYIRADRESLHSIMVNLIENAIKYGERKDITVTFEEQGDHITLSVKDLGIGIPEPERRMIFSKFYRVGSEETRKSKGTGLGLYIVSQLARANQASISLQENSPNGSIFKVSFPKLKI